MAEPMLILALDEIFIRGSEGERQLARLARDLILLAGNVPRVKTYIDNEAVRVLDEGER
jgi:hypothetical protein